MGRITTEPDGLFSTGWILSDGRLVTAAHVFDGATQGSFIEFNIPPSSDCNTMGHPSGENKYTIYIAGIIKSQNHTEGNDWAIFSVYPNSITGKTPFDAQNAYFFVEQTTTPGSLQIIGFGSSSICSRNYASQSATGSYLGLDNTIIKDNVDTNPGNSGSPIINITTGKVIGVHTNGTCPTLGYNEGTSTFNTAFWSALHLPGISVLVDQRLSGSNMQVSTIGRWNGTSFPAPGLNPGTPISTTPGLIETLQGNQAINSSQKYNNWYRNNTLEPDILNHHSFLIRQNDNNFTSNFLPSYSGITIQTSIPEINSNSVNYLVGFSDPWLIDYSDPNYANVTRNEGSLAPFRQQTSPFSPDLSSTFNGYIYKGLFLHQSSSPTWQPPYYSVSFPFNQTVIVNGTSHLLYLNNWSSASATFQNASGVQTPVVFNSIGDIVTANLKVSQLSNITSAYANNSQRKFVRTPTDGYLHMVYESMGRVWYELSTNQGATWSVMNGGRPLDNGAGKLPSIDYVNYTGTGGVPGNKVVITFEQQDGYIEFYEFYAIANNYVLGLSNKISSGGSYNDNFNPAIACTNNEVFMVTWVGSSSSVNPGINYAYGYFDNSQYRQLSSGVLPGTDANSTNPTIYTNKFYPGFTRFNIAYEQYNPSTHIRDIDYAIVETYSDGSSSIISGPTNISSGAGSVLNYRPSILATSDGGARVCWIGDVTGAGTVIETVFKDPTNSRFWYFGSNVVSTSINCIDDNSAYYVAWSQNTSGNAYTNKFTDSGTLSHISTTNTTGKDIQLSNGAAKSSMYISSFSPFTAPYFFTTSNNLNTFAKTNANAINSGRGGVITKNGAQFFYSFGDLTIDNNNIDFVKAADTIKYNNLNEINNVLVTNPFTVNNNSTFIFSECSGVLDSLAALSVVGDSGYVSFKAELIDNSTNNVIGTIRDSRLNANALHSYNLSSFNLGTDGLSGKTVKVKITISTNLDSYETALTDRYADASSISKTSSKALTLQGSTIIKEYSLDQNYPNPFNPTTIISYQIPKDGLVTVKIYDILGNEVKTLTNGYKTVGKYSVSFDASRLASGVYFYQLRSNGFVSTKKMLLLK